MNALRSSALALLCALPVFSAGCSKGAETEAPVAPPVAAQTGAQRLTIAQYQNSIHDIFGEDIQVPAALEPDISLSGFVAIGASASAISPRGIEEYEDAAYTIAAQVLDEKHRARLLPCTPKGIADSDCAKQAAAQIGRRVYRRPLTTDEVSENAAITMQAAGVLGDFYQGLQFGLAALLQAPSFLYRPAQGEADPSHAGKLRYTSHEMATRLSFFLWNTTPDEELLDAADRGLLTQDRGLAEQAERMIASPRARQGLRNFVTEWLGLSALDQLSKDPTLFTTWSSDVAPAAREETLRDFDHLVFDAEEDFRNILTTKTTFVNPKLASMYQIEAPRADGFAMVQLPDSSPRRGLLGQISILSLYAHPTSSSATLRGKFVRNMLLCEEIPPPPVNVNTALPEVSPDARTLREREAAHMSVSFCAHCHKQMDPIGLGLENFDSVGRYRKFDNGEVIDATGDLDGTAFTGADDLPKAVREHRALVPCFVKKVYEYATGFVETAAELKTLDALEYEFTSAGHRVKPLLLDVVMSPGFRLASPISSQVEEQ